MDQRQARTAALLAGADRHLAPVLQALVGALVLQAHFATLADDRGDFRHPQLGGLLDRPVHPLAARQALPQVDTQGRVGLAGELLAEFDADILLADLDQLAEVFPAAAVEQLHGVARGVPQHAADVVGLGLGQVVLAEGERLVDEEAGQAHGDSRVVATGAQFTACRGALEPAPSERRGGDGQPGSRWSGWKSLTATLTASRVAMSMPSLATSARKSICSGVIT